MEKKFRFAVFILGVFIALAFYGAIPLSAYFALFLIDATTKDIELSALESASVQATISADPTFDSYYEFGGEASYKINKLTHCDQYDEDFNCINEAPDLCAYIALEPTEGELTEFGNFGEINRPVDESDTWDVKISAPCFDGECPADYNPALSGAPLPQEMKDKTFKCDLEVVSNDGPVLVKNFFGRAAYAEVLNNRLALSAVIHGAEEGFSNVAFIPGYLGSRLYLGDNQLWDPNFPYLPDLEKLKLDEDGNPAQSGIYTRDIVDETFQDPQDWPGTNTYKTFIQAMDIMVDDNTINEWKALPYDWRFNFPEILHSGKKIGGTDFEPELSYLESTSTPYIIQKLRHLAETSKNGKVTIVTHSNGGLMAKYLLQRLENEGDPLLRKIDKLIMVAPPQVGTPKGLSALLHGVYPANEATRELSENMPAAYNFLPSMKYFDTVESPVLEFTDDIANVDEISELAGDTIANYAGMKDFSTGHTGEWSEPAPGDTDTPNVLDSYLITSAENMHTTIDSWTPPVSLKVFQVVGWGLDTIRGIRYDDCDIPFCADTLNHLDREPIYTIDGDETVVSPSAAFMANAETFYLNLRDNNFLINRNRRHGSIMEVDEVQELISNIFQNKDDLPENISAEMPNPDIAGERLRLRVHSPVEVHIYDEFGNHTGIIPNPDPLSNLRLFEENVPNSYYTEFGETKYIGSGANGTTTLKLVGELLGLFTLEIEKVDGDQTATTTVFEDIPIALGSIAQVGMNDADVTTALIIDADGDGLPDVSISPGAGVTVEELLALLKGIIKTLDLPDKREKSLIKKIEKIEKILAKEPKNERAQKMKTKAAFSALEEKIKQFEKKKLLTKDEARELLEIVEKIRLTI